MKLKKLRVGVIGVGHLGQYHVQKYLAMPEVELMGVVDTDPRRLQEISKRYGATPFSTHHELLPKVDAVSLAEHAILSSYQPNTVSIEPWYPTRMLQLPLDRPLVRPANAVPFERGGDEEKSGKGGIGGPRLVNPHQVPTC